jgi:putative protein-disulfide isomerase
MTHPTLHYIHDPLCGWCYAIAPLIQAARGVLPLQLHGGGLMTGARRQPVTPQLRDDVMPHDRRIAELTGQPFGDAYFDGLLRDTGAVYDSEPPIAALLAAEQLGGRGADLFARLQTAHYVEGRRIADAGVLLDLAAEIGLQREAFAQTLATAEGAAVQAHMLAARALLQRLGGQGFPTLALEVDGEFRRIDANAFLGQPQRFADWLRAALPGPVAAEAGPLCTPEGCALPAR